MPMYSYGKLRGRLAEMGMSQEELARKIHLSATSLNNKMNGKVQFKQNEMMSILNVIRVPVDQVVDYFFAK